jgi:hypothetical protein
VLHLNAAHAEPCPTGTTSPDHHQRRHDHEIACCCDGLGCTSAIYLAPEPGIAPAEPSAQIRYDVLTASLAGLAQTRHIG